MRLRGLFTILCAIGAVSTASAQNLGEQELQQLKGSFVKDAQTVAVQNVLMSDKNIKNKTLNKSAVNSVDHFFKYRVDVKGITDQQSSGRCWMFTSMNALRPIAMEKYNVGRFDFSHNYTLKKAVLKHSFSHNYNVCGRIRTFGAITRTSP